MILSAGICNSFKRELLEAKHDFNSDAFFIALYSAAANLSVDTTTGYVTDGEVSGPGYIAGGLQLQGVQILGPDARASYVTWDDAIWPSSQITARGALIYNKTSGQRAVAIMDFVRDCASSGGDFWVQLPPPAPSTAVVRLS
jgi:hypothetical protein